MCFMYCLLILELTSILTPKDYCCNRGNRWHIRDLGRSGLS